MPPVVPSVLELCPVGGRFCGKVGAWWKNFICTRHVVDDKGKVVELVGISTLEDPEDAGNEVSFDGPKLFNRVYFNHYTHTGLYQQRQVLTTVINVNTL